ncbi:MAG: cell division protein SepF, partial [Rhodoglobus sp.]
MANPLRRTMVYLGLADEDYEYDQQAGPIAPVAPVAHSQAPAQSRASVTPLRRPAPRAAAAEMNEILTVHPRQYKDAQIIAENFREGIPVIINLTQMSEPDARRLID